MKIIYGSTVWRSFTSIVRPNGCREVCRYRLIVLEKNPYNVLDKWIRDIYKMVVPVEVLDESKIESPKQTKTKHNKTSYVISASKA